MDSSAPNLQIESTLRAFHGLAANAELCELFLGLESGIQEAWGTAPKRLKQAFRQRVNTPERVGQLLTAVAKSNPASWQDPRRRLERAVRYAARRVRDVLGDMQAERWRLEKDDSARRALDGEISHGHQLRMAIGEVESFLASPSYAAMDRNALLLLGTWGTGKTHFMCDLTRRRMEEGKPTLLVLAQHLARGTDPRDGIIAAMKVKLSFGDLLVRLQELGEESGERALLLVDGINEGDRAAWGAAAGSLARAIAPFSHVGLALSCRRPFELQMFDEADQKLFVEAEHSGFEEIEIDAQLEFFDYYDIPVPQYPLITPEFSNPLFLKVLCEAIMSLSRRNQNRTVREIASGQRGMTHVLEHFVRRVGKPIEREFGLPAMTCWKIVKGYKASGGSFVGLAPIMALGGPRDYVTKAECQGAIQAVSGLSEARAEAFLQRMITEGLLAEGLQWDKSSDGYEEVIRFPYQRFGDHIVARHLLDKHLNTESANTIRRSLYVHRPLGSVFELMPGGYSFANPGLASALMLEFPERVKRVLPDEERELVFYLPRARQRLGPLKDVFLEGLHWRSSAAFTRQTNYLVNLFLHEYNEYVTRETLDILTGLASRPGHPYSASRLWGFVKALDMPDRDLLWSEYLRNAYESSVVYRLLEWIERRADEPITDAAARDTVRLLALFLTTTNRRLRDRTTRALVLIGLRRPNALFDLTVESLDFNDLYVPERVLAASYGVAMNYWADPEERKTQAALPAFARSLVDEMFMPGAPHSTRHVLMRGYALGVVELARRVAPGCVASAKVRYTKPPFVHIPSPFSPPEAIPDEYVEDVKDALHMDFNNYTLGRLIPDRSNYDAQHEEYRGVRRQVFGRMKELGYSSERFGSIDRIIADQAWRARNGEGKIDRYGKKYSWIAYFEMYGVRQDAGALAERRMEDRTSDCDIDPSFPVDPRRWTPTLPQPLGKNEPDPLQWLRKGPVPSYEHLLRLDTVDGVDGPWVLLDGFVEQGSEGPRQVFTFLRGVFMRAKDVDGLREVVEGPDGDRGDRLPEPGADHYTYAGEIPWSSQFGQDLRGVRGAAVRNFQPLYERFSAGRWVRGARVEVPVHRFAWETHHSAMNQVSGVMVPAPALCERLRLHNRRRTFELFDPRGRQATVCRRFKVPSTSHQSHLLYLRKDLLESYLSETRQAMVWVLWGERMLWPLELLPDSVREALTRHYHVHKTIVAY